MPMYDRSCESCEHLKIDCLEPITFPPVACEKCGGNTKRVFTVRANSVIGDDIPGGFVFDHVVPGLKVYSQSEKRRVLKEHGYMECVEHKTQRGTDKSRHTTRWV